MPDTDDNPVPAQPPQAETQSPTQPQQPTPESQTYHKPKHIPHIPASHDVRAARPTLGRRK